MGAYFEKHITGWRLIGLFGWGIRRWGLIRGLLVYWREKYSDFGAIVNILLFCGLKLRYFYEQLNRVIETERNFLSRKYISDVYPFQTRQYVSEENKSGKLKNNHCGNKNKVWSDKLSKYERIASTMRRAQERVLWWCGALSPCFYEKKKRAPVPLHLLCPWFSYRAWTNLIKTDHHTQVMST